MMNRIIGTIVIVISLSSGWFWISYQTALDGPLSSSLKEPVIFEINNGDSLRSVAEQLHSQQLLDHPGWFQLMARLEGKAEKIKVGEYQINPEQTPRGLMAQLVSGKVFQHSLTLVEGWTFKQVVEAINSNEFLNHTIVGLTEQQVLSSIDFKKVRPEGWFLPDTYLFPKGMSDTAFLRRAWHSMERALDEAWRQRDQGLPFKTAHEALILASIVEKETGRADERPVIAGVFVRRLQKGMRLQTDPTVIYGMGDDYDGNIRKRDLRRDTPYNTYTRFGLPPTPIAMPGREAIRAVLHPAKGNSLFFVAKGDGTGSHVFSSTLKEHNRAVDFYQKKKGIQ